MINYKRVINICLAIVYAIIVTIILPVLVYERNRHFSAKVEAWFVGGIFVLATLPISMYGILQHSLNYNKPHLQKYIIRILFMVPIYALNSWIVLKFPKTSIYLDTIRECYEAFVIYNFMMYLCNFLKYEVDNIDLIQQEKQDIRWLCCMPSCVNGISVLNRCKFGVIQYTIIRILTSFISYISEIFRVYNEGEIDFKFSWSYVVIANNFSQMVAMFCLILFYTVFKTELTPLSPIKQYLCIKFVVFATFWQSVLIAILVKFSVISPEQWPYFPTLVDTVNGLQDFLICIEMFLASVAHVLAFPVKPYEAESSDPPNHWISNLGNAANVSDLHFEVKSHYNHFADKVKRALTKNVNNNNPNESSKLLDDSDQHHIKIGDDDDDDDDLLDDIGPRPSLDQMSMNNQNEITIII